MVGMRSVGKGVLALGVMASVLSLPALGQSGDAEVDQLKYRLEALEREVTDMRSGAISITPNLSAEAQGDPTLSTILVRLDQLETQISELTGQLEEIQFRIQQNATEISALGEDVDYRLRALEGGAPASRPASSRPNFPSSSVDVGPATTATQGPSVSGPGVPYAIGDGSGDVKAEYDAALALLRSGDYVRAEAAMKAFVAEHKDSEFASNAQYWLGEVYYTQGRYKDAAEAFLGGVKAYPNGSKAADSMLKLGMSLAALGQTKEACTTFTEITRRYPNAPQTIIQNARNEKAKAGCY
ncbi:MAG: tol-pal system protein YbgF [Alphaproteobacteria bacterium]|nr:MAG: tol-pal system protein YbgF [Alphaproteobacteria bacterium]